MFGRGLLSCQLLLSFLGQSLGSLDVEAICQDHLNFFQFETRQLWVTEVTEQERYEGQSCEKCKSTRWSDVLQHGQECGGNDQRTTPVGGGRVRRTDTSYSLREKLGLLPWHGTDTKSVERGVHDDGHDHHDTPGAEATIGNHSFGALELDIHKVEGNGANNQGATHTR